MPYTPEHFLERDTSGSRLMAHARLLLKLARRFEAVAPPTFRHAARVANFKNGILILHVDSGAVAVKIRQMSQRLSTQMSTGNLECEGIEVKVVLRQYLRESPRPQVKPLSGQACATLRSRADSLPQGPLREALEKLLTRAATRE